MHYKSLGSGADKSEWIAGYERNCGFRRWGQDSNVVRSDNLQPVDFVARETGCALNQNLVAGANVFQTAKVGIAMAGDPAVSGLSRKSSTFDVSNAEPQCPGCGAFKDCHRHAKPWDFDAAQHIAFFGHLSRQAHILLFLRMDPWRVIQEPVLWNPLSIACQY
jgi:hypothetical protein